LLARIRFGVAVKAWSFFRKKLISPLFDTLARDRDDDHAVFVVVQLVIEKFMSISKMAACCLDVFWPLMRGMLCRVSVLDPDLGWPEIDGE
jgi:hypothetical protein